jgi:hypothetical protein
MPDVDLDNGADPQDEAETFDETHREDELQAGSADESDDPDIADDVYDVTSALGDADNDGLQYALDAADFGPEDIDEDDLEEDEDEDDDLDDEFEDEPEDDDIDDDDDPVDSAAASPASSEPGLTYVADVDPATYPRDDEVEKYESSRELSDAQLRELGYRGPGPGDNNNNQREDNVMAAETPDQPRPQTWEERSFAEETDDALITGSGATADDVEDESDPDEDERLDEGLEETFPASDPVSAKHIT